MAKICPDNAEHILHMPPRNSAMRAVPNSRYSPIRDAIADMC
jgi:hypothetical protein